MAKLLGLTLRNGQFFIAKLKKKCVVSENELNFFKSNFDILSLVLFIGDPNFNTPHIMIQVNNE